MRLIDLKPGDSFSGYYVLDKAAIKTNVRGEPFLAAEISDKSKMVPVKFWNYIDPIVDGKDNGTIVFVEGNASEYNGTMQAVLSMIRKTTSADVYDKDELVPVAPIDLKRAYQDVVKYVQSIKDQDYRNVASAMLQDHKEMFCSIPAAKSVHHAFVGGLLMHTYCMLRLANGMAELYKGVINRDLLLTGVLLHDFAKRKEFEISGLGLVSSYSMEGELLGHLVMGAQEVAKVCERYNVPNEKAVLLQHLILSHHGEPDFGAAVVPKVAEAELLHNIDMIDARMELYREELEGMEEGEMSERAIFALGNRRIFKPSGPLTPFGGI